jgi:serine/threonine-protein kinase RsbW
MSGPASLYPPVVQAWHLEGGLSGVAGLVQNLDSFLRQHGWSDDDVYRITLVVDELLTNTVSYGYPPPACAEQGSIRLRIACGEGNLHLVLQDDGIPFNPLDKADPLLDAGLEERPVGGLGIYLAHTLTDRMAYERQGHLNVLTLESHQREKD